LKSSRTHDVVVTVRKGEVVWLGFPWISPRRAQRTQRAGGEWVRTQATGVVAVVVVGPLRFTIVGGNPDYIRKIAAAIPPDSGIELVTEKYPPP
jgi:hypothetical protein